ncbi:hypothetical protein [Pseudomonas sp. HMWF021]|uniref:hypothetical protein n=1 Tax=Pseudomonas sp. HMWF021 TaxID=2056857 RepID=UPI001304F7F7|nr:hypothetical protein [Pseudomonas sp. HMWF021]
MIQIDKSTSTPVGAAAGCDLLMLFFKSKIKRSQPSAAPTGKWGGHEKAAFTVK